ncbi:hypothetical protein OG308_09175 [Nocardia salmonicida]|uniref:Uncharacterized protein n=1 Tax=Nocardia salmonicida TaxID=53431 RepID=A0ABZ1NDA0_9NOCA
MASRLVLVAVPAALGLFLATPIIVPAILVGDDHDQAPASVSLVTEGSGCSMFCQDPEQVPECTIVCDAPETVPVCTFFCDSPETLPVCTIFCGDPDEVN